MSLADILSLRDSCLSEQEVWAVCAECLQALQSIRPSHLFHTLCITPDTLAFNAHGNVCFMEQLSGESTVRMCDLEVYFFFFFTLSIKNWISYRKGLFELVREQLYGDVFNQSACFFVVFFNGGYTTLTKKWVFFISGKKELMVQWWPSVHSEDGVGESSWAHWWVTKLLPSSCITESSSYFRTICALNMADLYQYLKSPQNNSNAVFTQCSSIKHRRSDIMIQWYTFFILVYFDVNLQWINCLYVLRRSVFCEIIFHGFYELFLNF